MKSKASPASVATLSASLSDSFPSNSATNSGISKKASGVSLKKSVTLAAAIEMGDYWTSDTGRDVAAMAKHRAHRSHASDSDLWMGMKGMLIPELLICSALITAA